MLTPNVRPLILSEFQEVPKEKLGDCFLLSFGRECLEVDIAKAKSTYEAADKSLMCRIRFTLDGQQLKWAQTIMDIYDFDNFQEALNVCLLICKDHPLFNVSSPSSAEAAEAASKS